SHCSAFSLASVSAATSTLVVQYATFVAAEEQPDTHYQTYQSQRTRDDYSDDVHRYHPERFACFDGHVLFAVCQRGGHGVVTETTDVFQRHFPFASTVGQNHLSWLLSIELIAIH